MLFRSIYLLLIKYKHSNAYQIRLCGEMREYARLWSPYLSVSIPTLSGIATYMICVLYMVHTIPMSQKSIYIFITTEVLICLFALMQLCACVGKNNQKVVKQNRQLYVNVRRCLPMPTLFWLRVCFFVEVLLFCRFCIYLSFWK